VNKVRAIRGPKLCLKGCKIVSGVVINPKAKSMLEASGCI